MPVDPVDRESTLEFVAGSHLGPWLMPRTFMDDEAKWFPEGSLEELPDIEADRDAFEILGWELEPGDGSSSTCSRCTRRAARRRRRRAFSVRFLGDDVTHAPRPWKTSPEFPGLADELPAGRRWTTRSFRWSGSVHRAERPVSVADRPLVQSRHQGQSLVDCPWHCP